MPHLLFLTTRPIQTEVRNNDPQHLSQLFWKTAQRSDQTPSHFQVYNCSNQGSAAAGVTMFTGI